MGHPALRRELRLIGCRALRSFRYRERDVAAGFRVWVAAGDVPRLLARGLIVELDVGTWWAEFLPTVNVSAAVH